MPCVAVATADAVLDALQEGAGALLVHGDVLATADAMRIREIFALPEVRANLPMVFLLPADASTDALRYVVPLVDPAEAPLVTILRTPVRDVILVGAVRAALDAGPAHRTPHSSRQVLEATCTALRDECAALQQALQATRTRLGAQKETVRALTEALATAEQNERRRIAGILHDHLQQLVYGARVWAESLAARDDVPEAATAVACRIVALLNDAMATTRSLTSTLDPPALRTKGLREALQWLARHFSRTHGFTVHLDLAGLPASSTEGMRTLVVTLVRELLFNAVKHAGVDAATLQAHMTPAFLVLDVADEGDGFDVARVMGPGAPEAEDGGVGLPSIRDRLQGVGGRLHVTSAPGRGTHIRLQIPLDAFETRDAAQPDPSQSSDEGEDPVS